MLTCQPSAKPLPLCCIIFIPLIVRMRRCQLAFEARAAISSLPRSRTFYAILRFVEACQHALHLQPCASASWSQINIISCQRINPRLMATAFHHLLVSAMRTPAALRVAPESATSDQHALGRCHGSEPRHENPTVETSTTVSSSELPCGTCGEFASSWSTRIGGVSVL
ncbi:hypothetical protein BKA63DRAFT_245759 [Paraphoma chrysanthemicola]|nr:hypothetical protein BKA63DRAFT_245759 [Paraphoma chrysanthemicola]